MVRLALIIITLMAGATSSIARAVVDAPLTPPTAVVMWEGPAEVDGDPASTLWGRFCPELAAGLMAGEGAMGAGVFSKVTCLDPGAAAPKDVPWRVIVRSGSDAMALSVRYVTGMSKATKKTPAMERFFLVSRFILPPSPNGLVGLAEEGVAAMVATRLLDGMPMEWWFTKAELLKDGRTIVRAVVPKWMEMARVPRDLTLFRLSLDASRQLWMPEFIARARLGEDIPEEATSETDENEDESDEETQSIAWVVPANAAALINDGGLWAKGSAGRDGLSQDDELAIRDVYVPRVFGHGSGDILMNSGWVDGDRQNRVGMRYGRSLIPGSAFIRQQQLIGAFVDIQHGPMAGWRLFMDRVPTVNTTELGVDVSIGSDRYLIGFALTLAPGGIVKRIEITPRVGYWSLSAVLPTAQDPDTGALQTESFVVTRAGSFGLETGVELGGLSLVGSQTRLWFSIDRGMNLAGTSSGSAQAMRYGVDLWRPLMVIWKPGATDVRLLGHGFVFGESVSLNGGDGTSDSGYSVSAFQYNNAVAGLGLGVTW